MDSFRVAHGSVVPQDSEGFSDRLCLRQRVSLLSQMASTPTDCLFKVRTGRFCGRTRESTHPTSWGLLNLKCMCAQPGRAVAVPVF
jgi:hypothetical protein